MIDFHTTAIHHTFLDNGLVGNTAKYRSYDFHSHRLMARSPCCSIHISCLHLPTLGPMDTDPCITCLRFLSLISCAYMRSCRPYRNTWPAICNCVLAWPLHFTCSMEKLLILFLPTLLESAQTQQQPCSTLLD